MSDNPKGPLAAREEEILEFWKREKIFEKSLSKPSPKGEFIFYDGPPFASGLPHYGHILAGTIKDAIPRYRTMQGYHVPRQWGWDCHGLPVENLVEKELGLKAKRDIEAYGVEKFNEAARVHIVKDDAEWRRIIPRTGRWADMDLNYKTMDTTYTESVWWAFKTLYDKGLIYEGFKSLHYCPHCGTTLSNFEVAQGYKDIDDIAVTVKLPLVDEPGTSLLIWTTTPWSLPGNAAAAVKADAEYWKVKIGEESVIAAAEYFSKKSSGLLSESQPGSAGQTFSQNIQPAQVFRGKDLIGKRYKPPFDYFETELHKHKFHAWKVYAGDFVTLEDGTGIVHIAPAFGTDDLALAQANKIPLIHHVTDEGTFIATIKDFAHLPVKPKGNPRETDEKVAAWLEKKGLLFKKEKIHHSYPHCWRCDTPLLNWAADSWFVRVAALKGKLLRENSKVSWVPEHIGKGRFNNGIESAPDWAISRSRYWGAPLPVWKHSKTGEIKVAGSVNDMLSMVRRSGNRYVFMRHAEALSNVRGLDDFSGDPDNHLTERGKNAAKHAAADIKKAHIDLIIVSPFARTRETAAIIQRELGLPDTALMVDERLREGGSRDEREVRRRVGEFLFDIEQRYSQKNILIVSHGYPLWMMANIAGRKTSDLYEKVDLPPLASVNEAPFTPFPHNRDFELDLHRPYIDEVAMGTSVHGEWKRVGGVFDCWFESGSMPFASKHYPFEKKDFNPQKLLGFLSRGYPADFIAEGLDQTRGWFYSLLVLNTALFGRSPYRNVIVNGLVLASDGQKMSKRLKNYPDLMEVVDKYGADSLRYFLLSSPAVRAEDLRFVEQRVDEVSKKLLMRLDNVRSFYELYSPTNPAGQKSSAAPRLFVQRDLSDSNVLDRWILSRLGELVTQTTEGYETYQLDQATRPLGEFIDDLSTWYVRRSRDRFKTNASPVDGLRPRGADKDAALATLREVLLVVSKVMAPVMPFFADDLYRRIKSESDPESVHLCDWPAAPAVDAQLIKDMTQVRVLASRGLELREKANMKIRQPLATFSIKTTLPEEMVEILRDELNVKEVKTETNADEALDTTLTDELKEEGALRDFIRSVQELRKKEGLTIADRPALVVPPAVSALARKFKDTIKQETNVSDVEEGEELLLKK